MTCPNCRAALPPEALTCPSCRAPAGLAGLARVEPDLLGDRLARLEESSFLSRLDEGVSSLTRAIEVELSVGVSADDLSRLLTRIDEKAEQSLAQLEQVLSGSSDRLDLEGLDLTKLLDRSGEGLALVRKGLVFLKHRRFAEALEWWSVNRQGLDPGQGRLELLLLVMEAFTYSLQGDAQRLAAVRGDIRRHPSFRDGARGALGPDPRE